MFNHLSAHLSEALNKLKSTQYIKESHLQDTLKEVRRALLDADVALEVVKSFIEQVKSDALGHKVIKSVRPGDALVKMVHDALVHILGTEHSELNLAKEPPVVILMVGLQGSGKTTTSAKLAHFLQTDKNKQVMLASTDVYRPAAIDQLATLAHKIDSVFFPSHTKQKPKAIVKAALKQAIVQQMDVLIIDTAGRLHIDETLMEELKELQQSTDSSETLLVVDSMAGQDAANLAKTFSQSVQLDGIILTKTDGDARGGAALSMCMLTEKPIKFIGTGETIGDLSPFHPKRIASRILGKGDIVSLVEEAQRKVDKKAAEKLNKKLKKGKSFDFNDFKAQILQMRKMGGMEFLMARLPQAFQLKTSVSGMDDRWLIKMQAMIDSMTPKERLFPTLLNGSRKKRIALGAGVRAQDINHLLKKFTKMQKMTQKMGGNKMKKRMQHLQNTPGGLPPGLMDSLLEDKS